MCDFVEHEDGLGCCCQPEAAPRTRKRRRNPISFSAGGFSRDAAAADDQISFEEHAYVAVTSIGRLGRISRRGDGHAHNDDPDDPVRRQPGHAEQQFPDGPSDLSGVLSSLKWGAARLTCELLRQGHDLTAAVKERDEVRARVTHVTTSYSGIGFGEVGVHEGARGLASAGVEINLRFHGCVEKQPHLRRVLGLHKVATKAAHRFGCILSRIPDHVRNQLQEMARQGRESVDSAMKGCLPGLSAAARAKARATKVDEVGTLFFNEAKTILAQLDWDLCGESYCWNHRRKCALKPEVRTRDLWIELAGTTCVAWSSMSSSSYGWADESGLPCLVWAFWLARQVPLPDAIVHEIVPHFNWHKFFNDPVIWLGKFHSRSLTGTPEKWGVPSSRPRRYSVARPITGTIGAIPWPATW